ncbi:MAG TPA: glycosyltransferase family 4 protein [Vicinamibacteria bacterium]|nr:glycosyltransferase family 4 protein [Vicinamibacteria bacterium]
MRLLHVTPFYEPCWGYGGMARSSSALCRALAARGHEVTVLTALLEPRSPTQELLGGVRVLRLPGPRWLSRRLVPWPFGMRDVLRRELPSAGVVHLHGVRNGLSATAARLLASAGRSWLLTTHGCYPHHRQHVLLKSVFDRLAARAVLDGAAEVIAVSEAEARDLPRASRVIANGVAACGTPAATARGSGPPRLLFVGSDAPQKRGVLLPSLLAAVPEAELELVGRFQPGFLRRFGASAGRVRARGVLGGEALATAYAEADLLVHPAVGEAFGLAPFEAALAGTAAVVAGGHGCGEWYGRAGGCVVPPDDLTALVSAVTTRLCDSARSAAEARAVAEFATVHLTWERTAQAIECLCREVASRSR